jgi:hypothetical protein
VGQPPTDRPTRRRFRPLAGLEGEGQRVRSGAILFFFCLTIYHANFRPIPQVDTIAAPYAAWSLIRHGTFELQHYAYLEQFLPNPIRADDNGRWLSRYPPGATLAAVPIVLPLALAFDEIPRPGTMRRIGKFVGASACALAVVFFWLTCLRLFPREAPPATILFAFGTGLWSVASQSLWQHGPATLWLTLAWYAHASAANDVPLAPHSSAARQARYELMAGFALGMAVVTRPATALFGVAAIVAYAATARWAACARTSAGMTIPVGLLLFVNATLHNAPFAGGYAGGLGWEAPWVGAFGLLFAPSRGLFIYSPALLFGLVGAYELWSGRVPLSKAMRAQLLAGLVAAALTWLLYASSWQRWGGWCFGPRYLIETLPVLCLCVALASRRLRSATHRAPAWLSAAIAVSVLIHFFGVFGDDRGAWHLRHQHDANLGAFALRDSQIEAHVRHLLAFHPAD